MDITEVKVRLMDSPKGKIRAFCSIVFDSAFVVNDVKVIEEARGLFVAMPHKEFSKHCVRCMVKNPIRANFCNRCGTRLPSGEPLVDVNGHVKRHRDIAHPINSEYEKLIQEEVIKAYNIALKNPLDHLSAGKGKDGQELNPVGGTPQPGMSKPA